MFYLICWLMMEPIHVVFDAPPWSAILNWEIFPACLLYFMYHFCYGARQWGSRKLAGSFSIHACNGVYFPIALKWKRYIPFIARRARRLPQGFMPCFSGISATPLENSSILMGQHWAYWAFDTEPRALARRRARLLFEMRTLVAISI